jgi:2-C-methyl-D-erythritol 4-phosphate cytidylyltransferase
MFNSVLIVAAGKGSRMKIEENKLFLEIKGRAVLTRTLDAFQNHSQVNEIILVVNEENLEEVKEIYQNNKKYDKLKSVTIGGETRQDSVWNGLLELDEKSETVLIHDGARPFIEDTLIKKSIDGALKYGAACLAVPVKDTIKSVDSSGFVNKTLNRDRLWAVQTPQSFKTGIIKKAHEKAKKEGFAGTDDTFLVEKQAEKLCLFPPVMII